MSNLIHCDGPGCDITRDPNLPDMRGLCEPGWLRVQEGPDHPLDFHSVDCLGRWAEANGPLRLDGRACTCHGSQVDPHTKSEHQAYPQTTTVTGQ